MDKKKLQSIEKYRTLVLAANKETPKKELFKDLLHRLYGGDAQIQSLIDKISSGAEFAIARIPRKDGTHRGSADTHYSKVIIEFENDLRVTGEHAKEQLAGYLLGKFNPHEGYNWTLIASDFLTWKVYSPDVSCIDRLDTLTEEELILNEIPGASFTLTPKNAESFYYWIDRYLFREEKQDATLATIAEIFGNQSSVFLDCFRDLSHHFQDIKKFGEVQVSFQQWEKFLGIAYGRFEANENTFIVHTYLSIFAKLLAYEVLSRGDFPDDARMQGIIDGSEFARLNVANFVDSDFFHWVGSSRSFPKLKRVFRRIAQELATFSFVDTQEDILKGVYQELIDLDTRHALGEYYTPDWLCERTLRELKLKKGMKVLDPACGSGSFLRAVVHRFRQLDSTMSIRDLVDCIYGIDIHPLSVQIAKTTLLLALGKEIGQLRKPIHLNIILANSLLPPKDVQSLFGSNQMRMAIDKRELYLDERIFNGAELFNKGLEVCEELADQTQNRSAMSLRDFGTVLRRQCPEEQVAEDVVSSFHRIYLGLKEVKENKRDSIWKFIVQNLYKPHFLKDQFDVVVGNPPWLTYSNIRNAEYQNTLKKLAEEYHLIPKKSANFPHIEIAAIFLAYATNFFLKPGGTIAFVLPRSFFNADHHDNTRTGQTLGIRISALWDLAGVTPLFRIPSCVAFAKRVVDDKDQARVAISNLPGLQLEGKLPEHNCTYPVAKEHLTETDVHWNCIFQGGASAISTRKISPQAHEGNPYKQRFKQGATIVPRTFYFVELTQDMPSDFRDRILNVRSSEEVRKEAKSPWKDQTKQGTIESRFIYRTALAKSIVPFALHEPDLVILPALGASDAEGKLHLRILTPDELMNEGYLHASRWFQDVERRWSLLRTDANKNISSGLYLNWQSKLTEQVIDAPFLVLYCASAKDANATVIDKTALDAPFVVESKAYGCVLASAEEAHYLAAILNSSEPNKRIKDFQTRGLFGARDIHKRILDIYWPKYDPRNPDHTELARLGSEAHQKADNFLKSLSGEKEPRLGQLRIQVKKHVAEEMKQIDKIVRRIIR